MSCREHTSALRDLAAGGPVPAALRAHLESCAECRAVLDSERALLDRIDGTLREALAFEPSAGLGHRVRRLQEAPRSMPSRLRPAWLLAAAALVAVAWVLSGRTAPPVPVARETPAPAPVSRPSTGPAIPAVTLPVPERAIASRPRIRPGAAPRSVDPPVIVPAAEREALLMFYRSLRGPVTLASAAPEGDEAKDLPPLVIAPLLVPALAEQASPLEPGGSVVDDSIEGGLR